ncbi:hypothetical protein PG997_009833 [Apiospora hydei]|uniref:2EXR domain-containing protein n=1 Tax=Apiospora hydei TaxID=1337664 RepID=A0ABR1VYA8_9PEZI
MNKTTKNIKMKTQKVFPYFTKLPLELRRMIWKEFLKDESNSRSILMHHGAPCVRPKIQLISPLLSVTVEGRAAALKFYDTKLAVYHIYRRIYTISYIPKGHLYINMDEVHCKTMFDGDEPILRLYPRSMHFLELFPEKAPNTRYLGSLTKRLPEEPLQIEELLDSEVDDDSE